MSDHSRYLLETIIDKCFVRFSIADSDGVFLKISPNFTTIYGGKAEDYLGHNAHDLERRKILTPSVTVQALHEGREVQLILKTRLGRIVLAQGIPVYDENKVIVRVVTFSYDLTDLEVLRREYKRLQDGYLGQQSNHDNNPITKIEGIRFQSSAIHKVYELIQNVAATPANVLFLGESGVGKTLFARLLHQYSDRNHGQFVELNCAALTTELIEMELFGYEPGSFTGALKKGKRGLIEVADGGTLFLDEISELSLQAQAKLLKAVQDRQILRVGGTFDRTVDFRLIAATNQDLEELVDQGRFRFDLYYRINVIPIVIPPLQRRKEDLPLLIEYIWSNLQSRYKSHKVLHPKLQKHLIKYHWPGNVRELENVLERLFLIGTEQVVYATESVLNMIPKTKGTQANTISSDIPLSLGKKLEIYERELLQNAKLHNKSTYKMAQELGISQSSVVRKLKRYGI